MLDGSLELLLVLLLIVLNGVFSMSEIAVVSARRTRLQQRAEAGDAGARAALQLVEAPNRFLSTVQIGITLVGILTGAFGGAAVSRMLAGQLARVPLLAPYSEPLALALVVALITYLSLVIGELVPKRIGLTSPERIASLVARPMRLLSTLVSPAVSLLSVSTDLIVRLLGIRPAEEPPVTEEEIRIMLEQGTRAGVFEAAEQDMVENVFRLGDRRVVELMTPRRLVIWLDLDDPPEENLRKLVETPHIFYPVYRGSPDNVLGVLSIKDLWRQSATRQPLNLQAVPLCQPLFLPESIRAARVLELFKRSGQRIALVVDEYGGVEGLVTLADVVESITGDEPVTDAAGEPLAIERPDGSWLLDGMLSIDQLKETFDIEALPAEEEGDYQTVGGLVLHLLRRIPVEGDRLVWDGLRFEIVDMDGRRIDKVLVTREPAPDPAS